MKTSDVKQIQEVKEWGDGDRKTFYHNLEMENGDKINIGKKKRLQIGDNLNYEITGDVGQHEYTKAKSVNPEGDSYRGGGKKSSGSNGSFALSYAKDWCLGIHHAGDPRKTSDVLEVADMFKKWLDEN